MVSVVILHLLRLAEDASVSYVKVRQKEVRLAGIAVKKAQEKSCWAKLIYLVHRLWTFIWIALEKAYVSSIDLGCSEIFLVMFWRFLSRDFRCGGVSKPMPVTMAVSTDLIDFNVIFGRRNSIFNLPSAVWFLGMQPETKESWELLKSKCPLVFQAFSVDDKLFIGNGHGNTKE